MFQFPPLPYPLTFQPRFKERVWGARNLERLYGKALPPGKLIGESWEISDRPGDASVIANGPLAGRDLRWLMEHHAEWLLGGAAAPGVRFPLLVKILDAQEALSLQAHPPASKAKALGGEPKTEMWYLADTQPDACLYVGLKRGTTRADFERRLQDGSVAQCFQRLAVRPGDAMFLPSGRVHAIGAGCVIFEIQQNSDTTYRVFDWNRVGLDGQPRELHVAESLESIDFADFEPGLLARTAKLEGKTSVRPLVNDPLFTVDQVELATGETAVALGGQPVIVGVLSGNLEVCCDGETEEIPAGGFCLIPASAGLPTIMHADGPTSFLRAIPGGSDD